VGGGHEDSSQDGRSVQRISTENFLVVSEIQCESMQEQYCMVMLIGAGWYVYRARFWRACSRSLWADVRLWCHTTQPHSRTERMTHIEATSKSPECFRTFKKYNLDATFAHKMWICASSANHLKYWYQVIWSILLYWLRFHWHIATLVGFFRILPRIFSLLIWMLIFMLLFFFDQSTRWPRYWGVLLSAKWVYSTQFGSNRFTSVEMAPNKLQMQVRKYFRRLPSVDRCVMAVWRGNYSVWLTVPSAWVALEACRDVVLGAVELKSHSLWASAAHHLHLRAQHYFTTYFYAPVSTIVSGVL